MRSVRLAIVLDLLAIGVAAAALLLAIGLPLAARGRLGPVALGLLAASAAALFVGAGSVLLGRAIARPVDRILGAAEALRGEAAGGLPLLGPAEDPGGPGLSRAAVAFERALAALAEDRARLASSMRDMEAANRKLAEARESLLRAERLATLGRLASGIAHEIGNPLGAITGYVELARDRLAAADAELAQGQRDEAAPERAGGSPEQPAREGEARASPHQDADDFLARIAAEAQRIDAIVRDLLDLARPTEPVLGAVDLAALAEGAVRLAKIQARFRAVEVALAIPASLPRVVADERRLVQVILNLLLNAGDAMAGQGKVRIAACAERGGVEVEVADDGPGVPAADLPRVFEPFFTTKGAGQGTGLGLAVSLGIVESFGGELRAGNAPAGGAIFTLWLRAAAP
jgi:signal transduction histidine kinase